MTAPLSLRLAARELRGGLRGFRVFLAVLALGVSIIAAVGSLSASLVDGLRGNARALLGGDIELDLATGPVTEEQLAYLRANTLEISAVRDLRAMARPKDGLPTLVQLKAVDTAYPLIGAMQLSPHMSLSDALACRDICGIAVEDALLARLQRKGDAWQYRTLAPDSSDVFLVARKLETDRQDRRGFDVRDVREDGSIEQTLRLDADGTLVQSRERSPLGEIVLERTDGPPESPSGVRLPLAGSLPINRPLPGSPSRAIDWPWPKPPPWAAPTNSRVSRLSSSSRSRPAKTPPTS